MKRQLRKFFKDLGKENITECGICKKPFEATSSWMHQYKGKQVDLCPGCKKWYYTTGYQALKEAEAEINVDGRFKVLQVKEKFGIFMIYTSWAPGQYMNSDWLNRLAQKYKEKYKGFTFSFR